MYFVIKRFLDIFLGLIVIIIMSPLLLLISILIITTSGFPVIYKQERVGLNSDPFYIFKFRSMVNSTDQMGPDITSHNDKRITLIGKIIRKYKIDELPQFLNVIRGDMSIVGPRPEIRKYVEMFSQDFKEILSIRPGISDFAAIRFRNEENILGGQINTEEYYQNYLLPQKIILNKKYVAERSFFTDCKIILSTIKAVITN